MVSEKARLINFFLKIKGKEKIEQLKACKSQCELFLLHDSDRDIEDLINVISALIIYFQTGDKEEPREWVSDLWWRLGQKDNLSLFEIRILNCLLFIEPEINKVIEFVQKSLTQLDVYQYHEDYIKVKITINLNLVGFLIKANFFDSKYKEEYDEIIQNSIKEVISLNLKSGLNNRHYVGLAQTYKGILLKDEEFIYIGTLLLRSSTFESDVSLENLIELYIKKYNIKL